MRMFCGCLGAALGYGLATALDLPAWSPLKMGGSLDWAVAGFLFLYAFIVVMEPRS